MIDKFVRLPNVARSEIQSIVAFANELEKNPVSDVLKGKVLALLFMNPSLRTLASFQAGISQLGGSSFVIQPGAGSWNLELNDGAVMDGTTQEHIREAIPVLASYGSALAVRCFAAGKDLQEDLEDALIDKMAGLCPKPFINMESGMAHPCQALADWKSLDNAGIPYDGNFVLSWAWHPRPLPYAVPMSAAEMALMRGMNVTICAPEGFDLPQQAMDDLKKLGNVIVERDPKIAYKRADAVYVKSWAAPSGYGNVEAEAEIRSRYRDWTPNESWFGGGNFQAKVMHCLPVRRNAELADDLIDGPRSLILKEAENRLHAQKALLVHMLKGGTI